MEHDTKTCTIYIQTIDEPSLEIWGAMKKSHLLSEVLKEGADSGFIANSISTIYVGSIDVA